MTGMSLGELLVAAVGIAGFVTYQTYRSNVREYDRDLRREVSAVAEALDYEAPDSLKMPAHQAALSAHFESGSKLGLRYTFSVRDSSGVSLDAADAETGAWCRIRRPTWREGIPSVYVCFDVPGVENELVVDSVVAR